MPNNFNNNANKKDLQGSSIKYTTWRLNYQNDTTMEQSGGMIPSGESSNLEDNKTAIIDVSTYIEPIEINPSDNYDGMKKATIILNNNINKLYAWATQGGYAYYTINENPKVNDNVYKGGNTGIITNSGVIASVGENFITVNSSSVVYNRNEGYDISFQ